MAKVNDRRWLTLSAFLAAEGYTQDDLFSLAAQGLLPPHVWSGGAVLIPADRLYDWRELKALKGVRVPSEILGAPPDVTGKAGGARHV